MPVVLPTTLAHSAAVKRLCNTLGICAPDVQCAAPASVDTAKLSDFQLAACGCCEPGMQGPQWDSFYRQWWCVAGSARSLHYPSWDNCPKKPVEATSQPRKPVAPIARVTPLSPPPSPSGIVDPYRVAYPPSTSLGAGSLGRARTGPPQPAAEPIRPPLQVTTSGVPRPYPTVSTVRNIPMSARVW